ncbi:MAG: hypothetical protein D8B57_03490 [Prevotella sp.]|nr:MAG: hypothetical protein D8B57_03490 [Prevotella sp.]
MNIRRENDSSVLALQKTLFCKTKEPVLPCKTGVFMRRNNGFCYVLIMKWLHHAFRSVDFLHHCLLFFIYMQNCEMAASIRQRVGRKLIFPYCYCFYPVCFLPSSNGVRLS